MPADVFTLASYATSTVLALGGIYLTVRSRTVAESSELGRLSAKLDALEKQLVSLQSEQEKARDRRPDTGSHDVLSLQQKILERDARKAAADVAQLQMAVSALSAEIRFILGRIPKAPSLPWRRHESEPRFPAPIPREEPPDSDPR